MFRIFIFSMVFYYSCCSPDFCSLLFLVVFMLHIVYNKRTTGGCLLFSIFTNQPLSSTYII